MIDATRRGHVRGVLEDADAGIVHEHVEPAVTVDGGLDGALDLFGKPRVGGDGERSVGPRRACARSRSAAFRPVIMTRAPCDTSASAMAKPMPFDPPVINATLPSSMAPGGEPVIPVE